MDHPVMLVGTGNCNFNEFINNKDMFFDQSIFICYKTDAWHSYASRDIIGIATTFEMAYALCKQQAKKEGEKLSKDQKFNLKNIKQTQGYSGDGEFQIEEVTTNTLL